MAWYNSMSDLTGSIGNLGNVINGAMNSIGLGNDFLADTPVGSFLGMAQNKEAKRQFDESMKFAKQQFTSAHQTEVADLEKAGLNPVLSATNGGSGASSSLPSPTAHMDNGSAGLGFLTNLIQGISSIKNANSAQTVATATDKKMTAEAGVFEAQKNFIDAQTKGQNISNIVKGAEAKNAGKLVESTLSKSPRGAVVGAVQGLGDVINEGSHTQTAKKFEAFGERLGYQTDRANRSKFIKAVRKFDKATKGQLKPTIKLLEGLNWLFHAVQSLDSHKTYEAEFGLD